MSKKNKVVIVGGAGFIGSWLTRVLTDKKYEVVIIDPLVCYSGITKKDFENIVTFRKKYLINGARLIQKKYSEVGKEVINSFKPDYIIHLGATPLEKPDDELICRKQIQQDIPLTYYVSKDAAGSKRLSKFIYMSSVFAYGDFTRSASEKTPINPSTIYGISKASGEFIVRSNLKNKNWIIVRTTSVYGFGDTNLRAQDIFIRKAIRGESMWVNNNANLDFIYIKDFTDGIVKILEKKVSNEDFHISGGNAVKLADFVKKLKKYYPDIKYEVRNNINDRPSRGTMNNSKAKKMLGWETKFNLDSGLEDTIKYYNKYSPK